MLDVPAARYPLIRGKRPREQRRRWVRRRLLALATPRVAKRFGLGVLALAVAIAVVVLAQRASAPDPVRELADSRAAMARGNYSAALKHARLALSVEPNSAEANVALATAALAQGDGAIADGALQRAIANGATGLHAMQAQAALLGGDLDTANLEATRAGRDPLATRVRAQSAAQAGDVEAAQAQLVALLAAAPRDGAAWGTLGRIRYQAGDISGATEAASRAVRFAPAHLDGLVLAGEIVRDRYGLVAALPWFEAALKKDAFYHPALIDAAATLGELGRYQEMLDATRRALQTRAGSPQALYLEAVLAARAGRSDLARSMLAKINGQIDDTPGVLLLQGALDYADGKPQQAIGSWSALLADQPMNWNVRRLLGAAQLRAGDPRSALATLRSIGLRDDADAYSLTLIARAFERTGQRGLAAQFLDRAAAPRAGGSAPFGQDTTLPVLALAAAQAGGDAGPTIEYIRGLLETGRFDDATLRAQDLANARPGAPAPRLVLGDILWVGGRPADALTLYRSAANLDFGMPVLLRLVEAAVASGQTRAAAAALGLYLAQNPEGVDARRLLANLQLAERDWDGAIETLEAVRTATGARDWVLTAQLAQAYAGADDPDTSLRYARTAYALQPASALTADAYAWALYGTGDVPRALVLAVKAVTLAPGDTLVRWHYAQLLAEAGRKDAARAEIARLLANPAFADRAAAEALAKAL
jgi:predicted Zn-dependent protease